MRVAVVSKAGGRPEEKLAARELALYLGRMYPKAAFSVADTAPAGGKKILVGVQKDKTPARPESFRISVAGDTATVAGADARGTLYAVYALLERLGCGFYLSSETVPVRTEAFSFGGWAFEDAPLLTDRMVFNWHNFLSSASSWELADWQRYIDQSAKMRFNTVMVHAYGNNPMFRFRHNGQEKPVGYLATTRAGRDWGTQHVNDVRRLIGGEVFTDPVFGASVAKVPEAERSEAAVALMKKVFAHARSRGMHITFALDVDTESANPQNIIRTLPASARFSDGRYEFANPDTPEGYAYYKAQAEQLFGAYPQIDRLAVWFRTDRTPWRNLQTGNLPPAWRAEFASECAKRPWLREAKDAPGMFGLAKVIKAFGRALREIGRADVELATGSWRFPFLKAADALVPRNVTVIPLDWQTLIDTPEGLQQLQAVQSGRKLIPIVWAHHDDRTYIGRPYTPFPNFPAMLQERGARGFGIIHWTTRPLDMYFRSLATQSWKATAGEPLASTCARVAGKGFGEYLLRFLTEAPMFGRETSNRFMDTPLKEPAKTMADGRSRLEMLERLNGRGELFDYFRDYERFILAFFEAQTAWERADAALKKGAFEEARGEIEKADARAVIGGYVQAARRGKISRGEEALIVSLNLRWLPYILSIRQAVGLEPVRIRFGPTQHEPLAQGAGANTFYVDDGKRMWKTLGEKETGAPAVEDAIVIEKPLGLKIGPITGDRLAPGRYKVQLEVLDREPAVFECLGQRAELKGSGGLVRLEREAAIESGTLALEIRPAQGRVFLRAAVLEPLR
ncbi:MAG: hypothetical protein ACE15B_01105 [Bryobacteraceae bacterium]